MTAASKLSNALKSLGASCGKADPGLMRRRPMFSREETGESTARTHRGRGPGIHGKRAEIASGRATMQQGLAATCKDQQPRGTGRLRENGGLSHEPIGAMKEG
jgi:hypothetical protein